VIRKQRTPIRDYHKEKRIFGHRALFSFLGICLLMGILLFHLYTLQVLQHKEYQTRSNDNRIKIIPIAPTRGIIYDRNGVILAENKPVYSLEITPSKSKDLQKTLYQLSQVLNLTQEELDQFNKERRHNPRFKPSTLKSQLTPEEMAKFAVHSYRFPSAEVQAHLKRYYPYGAVLTHVLGYVAKINDKDLRQIDAKDKLANYRGTYDIGKLGLEKYYEDKLHGTAGYQKVEVNSRGRIIHTLEYHPPVSGENIVLNLDIKLQLYVTQLLKGQRGAAIVIDPRDSGVLAMVSIPSYDPNLFVHGISSKEYKALLQDPNRPLINRATLGIYPPASTVKPAMAIAALAEGVITPQTVIFDPGYWQIPNSTTRRFRDWLAWGHGKVSILKSLEESVDTFYYYVAFNLGIDRISKWMRKFGYGEYTGIDITEESKANMPTREWKMSRYRKPWYQGDTVPVGIGQGYWTATPIQIVKVVSTIINNGIVRAPHLLKEVITNNGVHPAELTPYPPITGVKPEYWALAKEGMHRVTQGHRGTARRAFYGAKYNSAGKSGTAQVFGLAENQKYNSKILAKHLHDHALFVAFAPYEAPSVALSIVLENAGGGSSHGSPLARKILDYLLVNNEKEPILKKKGHEK